MAIAWNNKVQPKVVERTPEVVKKENDDFRSNYYWRNYGKEGSEWLEPFKNFIDLEYKQHYNDKTESDRDLTYKEKQKLKDELVNKYGSEDFDNIIEEYYKKNNLFNRK